MTTINKTATPTETQCVLVKRNHAARAARVQQWKLDNANRIARRERNTQLALARSEASKAEQARRESIAFARSGRANTLAAALIRAGKVS